MPHYEFTVIASGLDPSDPNFESRIYAAGCRDAVISFQGGSTVIDFSRESASRDEAVTSAIKSVLAVGAAVVRIEPASLMQRRAVKKALLTAPASGGEVRAALSSAQKQFSVENDDPSPVRDGPTRFDSIWDALESSPEDAAAMKRLSALMMDIRDYVVGAGLTHRQAAQRLGTSRQTISDIMAGKISRLRESELVTVASAIATLSITAPQ